MDTEIHQITSSLVSLVRYYKRSIKDDTKNEYAAESSSLIAHQGLEKSSQKEKLQFCSEAIQAISSEIRFAVITGKIDYYEGEYITSPLEKMEIDFIQKAMFTNDDKHQV
jgi:hypothetical protein